MITRYFSYDAANRVSKIAVASYDLQGNRLAQSLATVVDERLYDGAGHPIQQGINSGMAVAYLQALQDIQLAAFAEKATKDLKFYDANGLLKKEVHNNVQGQTQQGIDYSNYDAQGNLRAYSSSDNAGNSVNVSFDLTLGEGYLRNASQSTFNNGQWSSLNLWNSQEISYDVNGKQTQVTNVDRTGSTTVTSIQH
ncbi:hypothetical protein ACO0LF_04790 [Undibacterium sp. Di27W]|uniref:hypothetical protein n=1 Tax=Undibacterium sp. Di27W TaxID=3413036 RepID=UPI003BF0FA91